MLSMVRQYVAIIDIRKIGAHVTEESIKPYFNWLMPQASGTGSQMVASLKAGSGVSV